MYCLSTLFTCNAKKAARNVLFKVFHFGWKYLTRQSERSVLLSVSHMLILVAEIDTLSSRLTSNVSRPSTLGRAGGFY